MVTHTQKEGKVLHFNDWRREWFPLDGRGQVTLLMVYAPACECTVANIEQMRDVFKRDFSERLPMNDMNIDITAQGMPRMWTICNIPLQEMMDKKAWKLMFRRITIPDETVYNEYR